MVNDQPQQTVVVHLRMPKDVHDRVKEAATADHRSINGEINHAVAVFLADRGMLPGGDR